MKSLCEGEKIVSKKDLTIAELYKMLDENFSAAEQIAYEREVDFQRMQEAKISYSEEKGMEKGKIEVAQKMLAMNFSIDQIHQATGLDIVVIIELRDKK